MRGVGKGSRRRGGQAVGALIAASLPLLVRRSLGRGLSGVWSKGAPLPQGAFVLAANHHAWWDGYLAWLLLSCEGRRVALVMDDVQLGRFSFFRHRGAIGRSEPREALRRLTQGDVLVIYPEGALRPPGPPGPLHEGAAFFARQAALPLVPMGARVVVRGAEKPEAYLNVGAALAPGDSRAALTAALAAALGSLLEEIDGLVARHDPETPLPGFASLLTGTRSSHQRSAWLERLWRS
ncbi:MAG: 1-acyl-sn-glycerol-3-phosphate acyltransferase [Deinococcota bacterium]|nr:1-acyl-sn-glycerol-3-phosphate acyltransferase [Deinococcota bacterium]